MLRRPPRATRTATLLPYTMPFRSHFESSDFLTLLYLPPAEDVARAESWLYEGKAQGGVNAREILRGFVDRTDRLLQLIEGFMPERAWLDDAETLTYLHSTIRSEEHTSELQSLMRNSYAVFCLQKQNNYTNNNKYHRNNITHSKTN